MDVESVRFGGSPQTRIPCQQRPLAALSQREGEGVGQGQGGVRAAKHGRALHLARRQFLNPQAKRQKPVAQGAGQFAMEQQVRIHLRCPETG